MSLHHNSLNFRFIYTKSILIWFIFVLAYIIDFVVVYLIYIFNRFIHFSRIQILLFNSFFMNWNIEKSKAEQPPRCKLHIAHAKKCKLKKRIKKINRQLLWYSHFLFKCKNDKCYIIENVSWQNAYEYLPNRNINFSRMAAHRCGCADALCWFFRFIEWKKAVRIRSWGESNASLIQIRKKQNQRLYERNQGRIFKLWLLFMFSSRFVIND